MENEMQILIYKKKIAAYSVIFLVIILISGFIKAFYQHKISIVIFENNQPLITILKSV